MEWRDVKGFEGLYEVSSEGVVRTIPHTVTRTNGWVFTCKQKVLKYRHRGKEDREYRCVRLYKDLSGKSYSVHRLVAEAFIPNPKNLPSVNHIDGDKFNNCVSNLEWCDPNYNTKYADKVFKVFDKLKKPLIITRRDGSFFAKAKSIKEAAKLVSGTRSAITLVLSGGQAHHKGYKYEYDRSVTPGS